MKYTQEFKEFTLEEFDELTYLQCTAHDNKELKPKPKKKVYINPNRPVELLK